MSRKEVNAVLESTGIPCVHMAWKNGTAPKLPWMVFSLAKDGKLNADGERWVSFPTWDVELYQKAASKEVEGKVERAISEAFGDYRKTETWVDSEGCLMTVYTFTEFPKEE